MKRKFQGIWIPAEIWLTKELTLQEKVFFVEIKSLDNEKGCYANNQYFSDFFGISKTRVSLVVKSLIEKGYIKSTLIYKEGTKQILNRVLNICYIPPLTKVKDPPLTKVKDPTQQKLKDNNTLNNTLLNNTISNTKKTGFAFSNYNSDSNTLEEVEMKKEKNSAQKEKLLADAVAVIEYFNQMSGRKVSTALTGRGSDNTKWVLQLMRKGYKREEVELMIMFKCWEWKGNPKMEKNLRPITIFKRHGKTYIEDALEARDNPVFQAVIKKAKAAENKSNGVFVAGEFTKKAVETLKNW